ncbi:hypothetical protein [Gulosibacter bifidus]|uniref:Uncharacterized protein n=1 Tax=Gulosibacter bifidus TaxID=272239 RepID=A0ABW5RKH1_9MICO|nr:hypothetical protein [Gulosibacter bifidus]
MAELYIREGDLEKTSERTALVAAEVGNRRLSSMPIAEIEGMPGMAESGLEELARDLRKFMDDLAARLDEASNDCLAVAAEFANVDEAFVREFEVTIGDRP